MQFLPGVFLDCFLQQPLRCDDGDPPNCTAIRSHRPTNRASIVTAAQVKAYSDGHNSSLTQAVRMVTEATGGAFAAFTWGNKPNYNGANMAFIGSRTTTAPKVNATGLRAGTFKCT